MKPEHLASGTGRRLLAVIRRLFTPLALACLLLAAYASRDSVQALLPAADARRLAMVVLAWGGLQLLVPALASVLLRGLGAPIGYRAALQMHLARLPARYLPGGIWQTVARASDLQARGITKSHITALVALENLVPFALALLLGAALSLPHLGFAAPLLGSATLGAVVLVALPRLLPQMVTGLRLDTAAYLQAAAVSTLFWLLAAAIFALYWSAFPGPAGGAPIASVMGTYLLSWAAGLVAVFAPQGIGVFEAVAAMLLKGARPLLGVAVLVAGFRAATLAGDALAYSSGLAIQAWQRRALH